jgi:hypothetical protein
VIDNVLSYSVVVEFSVVEFDLLAIIDVLKVEEFVNSTEIEIIIDFKRIKSSIKIQ